jgi:hypothetical protein
MPISKVVWDWLMFPAETAQTGREKKPGYSQRYKRCKHPRYKRQIGFAVSGKTDNCYQGKDNKITYYQNHF